MSRARFALVRCEGLVLFLSGNTMVSNKLSDQDQGWKAYGISDDSKSYGDIRAGVLVFGLSVSSSFGEERETHNSLELDWRGLRLYDRLYIPD